MLPNATEWARADLRGGMLTLRGRRARLKHPGLWTGAVGAWSTDVDPGPWDWSGSGNHAQHSGDVRTTPEGWDLPGLLSPGLLQIADRASIDFGAGTLFSFSAWVRLNSGGLSIAIAAKGNANVTAGWELIYDSTEDAVVFRLLDSGGNVTSYIGGVDIADLAWHHVGFVVRSRNATPGANDVALYVDAVGSATLDDAEVGTDVDLDNAEPLRIGARRVSGTVGSHFNGMLTGVMMHRRALESYEMQLLATRPTIAYECGTI